MDISYRTLGEVATYINGRAFKPTEWEASGLPIIRIQNLTDNNAKYNYSTTAHDEKYLVHHGDLLFAWSASLGAHIWHGQDAWLNQHIFRVIPNDGIDKAYLYHFLCHVVAELYAKTHGSGMVHITKAPFMATRIPIPTLTEQQRIVVRIEELFSQLDSAVATLNTIKQQLAVYRQLVLHSVFASIESNYYQKFDTIIVDGPNNGIYKPKSEYGEGIRILRIDGFYDGKILDDYKWQRLSLSLEEIDKYYLQESDIVINRVNSMTYLGKCALVRLLDETTVFESNMMRLRVDTTRVNPEFLVMYLSSQKGRNELTRNAKQAVNQASINQTDVRNAHIPLPDLPTQNKLLRIARKKLAVCERIKDTVNTTLQQAEALRQSILKKAFEGRL